MSVSLKPVQLTFETGTMLELPSPMCKLDEEVGRRGGERGRGNAIESEQEVLRFLERINYKSREQRLNLSRSQQQGHSATYNTLFLYLSRMQRIYPLKHSELI